MKFLFETDDTKQIHEFKDSNEYTQETGTHWKTVQLKNNNGESVKCKLGKGKIWRLTIFHKLGPKIHCGMCKDKLVNTPTLLCEKHLKEKIDDNHGEYFFENPSSKYKGQQSGMLYMEFGEKVYKRAQAAHEH